jgi:hypothetical protein
MRGKVFESQPAAAAAAAVPAAAQEGGGGIKFENIFIFSSGSSTAFHSVP